MRVSVVIISYNGSRMLHCALRALTHQRLHGDATFEVVVVNDGSTDDTEHMLSREQFAMDLKVLNLQRVPESSRSRARNAGAAAASGEVLVFLDGDEIVTPDFVWSHLRRHQMRDGLVVLGMRSLMSAGEIDPESLRDAFDVHRLPPVAREDSRHQILARYSQNASQHMGIWHLCYSCNFSVPAALFRDVGGFDETFTGWGLEDCELAYRLGLAGASFVLNCETNCFDPWQEGKSFGQDTFEQWLANLERFKQKHRTADVGSLDLFIDVFRPPFQRHWLDGYFAFEDEIRSRSPHVRCFSDVVEVRIQRPLTAADLRQLLLDDPDALLVLLDEHGAVETEVAVQTMASCPGVLYFSSSAGTRPLPALDEVLRHVGMADAAPARTLALA